MHIRMPDLDAALDAGVAEADLAKRPARFQEVSRVFNKQLPWAPMWVSKRYGIVSSKVRNFVWTPSPGGGGYEQHAEQWAFT
jgi:peptide/nickel transport system substrate-binding protein